MHVAELSSILNSGTLWSKSGVAARQAKAFGMARVCTMYDNFVAN